MSRPEIHPLVSGDKFGRLTVIERTNSPKSIYKCKCECGNIKMVHKHNLTSGRTTSCGCLQKEIVSVINSKQNEFVFIDDYVIGTTNNTGKKFYFDRADYEKVKRFCWYEAKTGYIMADKRTMHRYLMNPPENMVVDHINHNKADNRRKNLRICTTAENSLNRAIPPIGIRIKKQGSHTYYQVYLNHKYRGSYKDYESAKEVRDRVYEEEYQIK